MNATGDIIKNAQQEVLVSTIPESYWQHLRQKLRQMEALRLETKPATGSVHGPME